MNYVITYETLLKNQTPQFFKLLRESGLSLYVITKEPKNKKHKVWFFCIINGLYPNKIYTSKYLFKTDIYSYRNAIIKIQSNNNHTVLINDDIHDNDLMRDLKNITFQKFEHFKLFVEKKRKELIRPFT